MFHMTWDPLGFLTYLHHQHGPFVALRTGRRRLYPLIEPELIKEVLVTQGSSFSKGRGLELARRVLGNGLLTANGEEHLRHRRMIQPAFHRQRLESYAQVMVEATQARLRNWRSGQCLCLSKEMMAITLDIITKTMFGDSIGDRAQVVESALQQAVQRFHIGLIPILPLLERLPLPSTRRFQEARQKLDDVILELIRVRRQRTDYQSGDLLSMLVEAVDHGEGLSDQQLRDEAMTIFLAGHETTANALGWTLALLAWHPESLKRVRDEVDNVLGCGSARFDDIEKLPHCRYAVQESIRLFPPAWIIARKALETVQIGDERLAPESVVLMSAWVAHRHSGLFDQPQTFRPERWADLKLEKELPKFGYFPFGGGNRVCIGENFAKTEAVLVLATVLQNWDYRLLAGMLPRPEPRITLRLGGGLPVEVRRRQSYPSLDEARSL